MVTKTATQGTHGIVISALTIHNVLRIVLWEELTNKHGKERMGFNLQEIHCSLALLRKGHMAKMLAPELT